MAESGGGYDAAVTISKMKVKQLRFWLQERAELKEYEFKYGSHVDLAILMPNQSIWVVITALDGPFELDLKTDEGHGRAEKIEFCHEIGYAAGPRSFETAQDVLAELLRLAAFCFDPTAHKFIPSPK